MKVGQPPIYGDRKGLLSLVFSWERQRHGVPLNDEKFGMLCGNHIDIVRPLAGACSEVIDNPEIPINP